jgi:hypothetical protein
MGRRRTLRHRAPIRRRQRGVALLVMVTIIALGASWLFVTALSNASASRNALGREDNGRVLAEAKHALAGWMIRQAIEAGENNPGRLPCPEAAGYIGTANEGIAAGNCTLPAIGRLPWRTLGLPKLRDASGEPLWYVVSPGWALPTVSSMLTINSNSPGQLTLDGTANAAVALVIAPGPVLDVQASAGCTARAQQRTASTPDFRDYLECENATSPVDASFVTNGPMASFNDQVVALTTRDVLPGLEAAIMKRIEREIVPRLKSVYGGNFNISAANPIYPYAAPFTDPGPGAGTSTFQGDAGWHNNTYIASAAEPTYQGLLPFNQTQNCTASASNPRCLPNLVGWTTSPWAYEAGGYGYIQSLNCYWEGGSSPTYDARVCDGEYHEDDTYPTNPGLVVALQARFSNIALGLRALDTDKVEIFAHEDPLPFDEGIAEVISTTASATLNANGTVTVTVSGQLPNIDARGWVTYAVFRVRVRRQVIGDHPLLDPNDATTGWFVRNEWFRLLYYAVAQGQTAYYKPSLPCTAGTNCLRYRNAGVQQDDKRALLLLAGRGLRNQTRPSATLTDYLDTSENADLGTLYEQARIDASVNDRVIVVDQN